MRKKNNPKVQGEKSVSGRTAQQERETKETSIRISLNLDGSGSSEISTGLPFFDHMLSQLGRHGGWDLYISAKGDLNVDAHHTVEDVGIVLGSCFKSALGDSHGIRRFGAASAPLDEALIDVALDLSGRPFLLYQVQIPGADIMGDPPFDPQLAEEFWRAFVVAAGITLHISLTRGQNTHHILESSFKGVARALRDAVKIEGDGVPSTKGILGDGVKT